MPPCLDAVETWTISERLLQVFPQLTVGRLTCGNLVIQVLGDHRAIDHLRSSPAEFSEDVLATPARIPLQKLAIDDATEKLKDVLNWLIERIKEPHHV